MQVPKSVFGLAKFTTRARRATDAVRFERDRIMATDGHRLVMWVAPDGEHGVPFEPFSVAADDCRNMAKGIPAKTGAVLDVPETEANGRAKFNTATGTLTASKSDFGSYPRVDAVIPKMEAAQLTIGLNARYLREICAQMEAHAADPKKACLVFRFSGPENAVRIDLETTARDTGSALAVLMPMHLKA